MLDAALDVSDLVAGVALVPRPIELLGSPPELHDEVTREVLGLGLASLLTPKLDQGGLVAAHDDAGVGAADEMAAVSVLFEHHMFAPEPMVRCIRTLRHSVGTTSTPVWTIYQ